MDQKKAIDALVRQETGDPEILEYRIPGNEEIREQMFPGPLLERCGMWGMPPFALKLMAPYHRVLIWQVHDEDMMEWDDERKMWKSKAGILFTDAKQDAEQHRSSRGIVLSAGLRALGQLNTNNIQVGDYVRFIRLVPFRIPMRMSHEAGAAETSRLVTCSAADVIASEDGQRRLYEGTVRRVWKQMKLPDGTFWQGYAYEGEGIPEGSIPDEPLEREEL